MNDTSSTLSKLRKVILSLQKEEMAHMQQLHGDALRQIVTMILPPYFRTHPIRS